MLSINTNISSLIAQSSMKTSSQLLNQAVERMSTGYKINHAKDNAANYSIATNMTTKMNSYMVAQDNVAMGLDMITTASDNLASIDNKLVRLRSLATQASNGTYGTQSLNAINAEANALVDEIARLYSTAEYNGIKLFTDSSAVVPSHAQAVARFAMRAATTGYTQEQIDAMTTLSEAYNAGVFVEGETYSISSVAELEKFRDMVNAGNFGAGSTFVLTKDLNLSGISNWTPIGWDEGANMFFAGVFDGNGHVISNLKINDTDRSQQGLFGFVGSTGPENPVEIKNLGLENVNVNGDSIVGALVGLMLSNGTTINITNNYSTGSVNGVVECAGGLVGVAASIGGDINIDNNYSTVTVSTSLGSGAGGLVGVVLSYDADMSIENNFATGNVSGIEGVGGLVGYIQNSGSSSVSLNNNFATGAVTGSTEIGGLIGGNIGDTLATITNCASVQADGFAIQKTADEILSPSNLESMGFTAANGWSLSNGLPVHNYQSAGSGGGTGGGATGPLIGSNQILLQVGIGADSASQIGIDLGFSLGAVDDLRMIGLDTTTDFLSFIDEMIATVSAKQVEYGAAQNRLESALDEISTQYENLASSRSTIRDADIAEVSSQYIQQQILQQAAATLMSTANQAPAIALQLI